MNNWSLLICGDCAPPDSSIPLIAADPDTYFGDLLPILRDTDLAVVNLEGVLSDHPLQPIVKDGEHIILSPLLAQGLKSVPFHVACLANNHSYDYGLAGLSSTFNALEVNGISPIGAGLTRDAAQSPGIYTFDQTRLAVLNVAEGEESNFENNQAGAAPLALESLCCQIQNLKQSVDVVIVIVHAGREHLPIPAPYIRSIYRRLVDTGADMVIGHHPHVPQGFEYYKDGFIAYSLGNFMMWMNDPMDWHRIGYFVKIHFNGKQRLKIDLWPYRIQEQKLCLLSSGEKEDFFARLSQLNEFISSDSQLNDLWEAYADQWLQSQGLNEILDSGIRLAGTRNTIAALLKSMTSAASHPSKTEIFMGKILWRMIHLLERKGDDIRLIHPKTQSASAVLRNRFDTPAHQQIYLTSLKRIMQGKVGSAPEWTYKLLDDWNVSAFLRTQ